MIKNQTNEKFKINENKFQGHPLWQLHLNLTDYSNGWPNYFHNKIANTCPLECLKNNGLASENNVEEHDWL